MDRVYMNEDPPYDIYYEPIDISKPIKGGITMNAMFHEIKMTAAHTIGILIGVMIYDALKEHVEINLKNIHFRKKVK